jgi:two-component system, chemotaxis family, protein-glutamate methylesterase/glutaminase
MAKRNIIVIGASAGGFEALKVLARDLPADLDASIFIVWHMPADIRGVLPEVLNRHGKIKAANAYDKETIEPNRIYVAPPDRHLIVESGQVRVTRGPKENRFRPAVDPLFRSAAHSYRQRVIGVILSGALDDGTSGLWTVKYFGGVAVVQDPRDAEVPSMPENALNEVAVDHVVPVSQMAELLVRLSRESIEASEVIMEDEKRIETEVGIAKEDSAFESGIMSFGRLTPFTCPECHGVLTELRDNDRPRYRCHTGHAFTSDTLLATVTENIEDSMWNTIRGIEESIMLLDHMGQHFSETNNTEMAMLYIEKAREARERVDTIRQAVMTHENLSSDRLRDLAAGDGEKRWKAGNQN